MRFRLDELRSLISEAVRKAYEILGVSQAATPEEIKLAYRKKAIALHPDRNPGKDTGPEMVKLNVAYGLLSDPEKRRRYDMLGDKTLGDAGGFGYSTSQRTRPQSTEPPRRQPPPAPRTGSTAGTSTKRYFTYIGGTSRKFWECERRGSTVTVRWGRVGTPGQTKTFNFDNDVHAIVFARNKISEKLGKGYREQPVGPASNQPPRTSTGSRSTAQSPPPPAANRPRQTSKSTYKIYGKKGNAPAHTRYQGKVYVGASDTRFRAGDQATVALGTDGRLSVHDPETGHTQHWTSEALEHVIKTMISEVIKPLF